MLVRSTAATVGGSGLRVLTLGYGAILLAVAATSRRSTDSQRAPTAVALAAFAISARHLSRAETSMDSSVVELICHPCLAAARHRHSVPGLSVRPRRPLFAARVEHSHARRHRGRNCGLLIQPLAASRGAPIANPALLMALWIGTALLNRSSAAASIGSSIGSCLAAAIIAPCGRSCQ